MQSQQVPDLKQHESSSEDDKPKGQSLWDYFQSLNEKEKDEKPPSKQYDCNNAVPRVVAPLSTNGLDSHIKQECAELRKEPRKREKPKPIKFISKDTV